jgi:hypothetical protein
LPKSKPQSTQHKLVQCDLEFTGFINDLVELESSELDSLFKSVEKINQMTWMQVLATSSKGAGKRGLNWEVLPDQKTASGRIIATIRITKKIRARVTRDGVFMRFISLHPDHDSAYSESGGENI